MTVTSILSGKSFKGETKFDIVIPESVDKKKYTKLQKFIYLFIAALCGIQSPLSSTIYIPCLIEIKEALNTTEHMVDISISVFMLFLAIAPLLWGNLADKFGRKPVYIMALLFFFFGNIGCLFSKNIIVLIFMRILQSFGSSAGSVVGVGVITDLFAKEERGFAFGLFFLGPMLGPVIGPLIGGYLSTRFNWQAIFIFLAGFSVFLLCLVIIVLPETLQDKSLFPFQIQFNPFKITKYPTRFNILLPLKLLNYSIVLLVMIYAAIDFSIYMGVETTQPLVMVQHYNLSPDMIGVSLIPLGVGDILGSLVTGKMSDILIERSKKNETYQLETRLKIVCLNSFIGLLSYIIFGWLVYFNQSIYLALLFQILIGFSMTSVMIGTSAYLVDLFPAHSSTISACNNLLSCIGSALITSFSSNIFNKLKVNWTFSLFALLGFIGYFILLIILFTGRHFRYRKIFK